MLEGMDKKLIEGLQEAITKTMIEAVIHEESVIRNETVKEYVCVCIQDDYTLDFLKAIGLRHFGGNEEAQLVVNDFIGVLKDMYDEGKETLHRRD